MTFVRRIHNSWKSNVFIKSCKIIKSGQNILPNPMAWVLILYLQFLKIVQNFPIQIIDTQCKTFMSFTRQNVSGSFERKEDMLQICRLLNLHFKNHNNCSLARPHSIEKIHSIYEPIQTAKSHHLRKEKDLMSIRVNGTRLGYRGQGCGLILLTKKVDVPLEFSLSLTRRYILKR